MTPTPSETDTATLVYRVNQLETIIFNLQAKVERLVLALITLSCTIGAASVVFALTTLAGKG